MSLDFFRPKSRRSSIQTHMTFEDFLDFLFSPQNGILDSQEVDIVGNQDDNQPLSDYFINSSHNTYLTGNQVLVNVLFPSKYF